MAMDYSLARVFVILTFSSSVLSTHKYGRDLFALGSLRQSLVLAESSSDSSGTRTSGYEIQMIHRDHQESPLRVSNIDSIPVSDSVKSRFMAAATRSRERANALQQLHKHGKTPKLVGVSPVFSQNGEYIIYLTLGTPAKTYVTIIDTGSDLVWVQCSPCQICFTQPDPVFDPSSSSSYSTVNCTSSLCSGADELFCGNSSCLYTYGYGDGSFTAGALSLETVTLNTTDGGFERVKDFTFGCGTENFGDFSGTDGLVGFGRGSLSMMSQLTPTLGNKFSYCLVSFTDAVTKTSPLLIGKAQVEPDLKYTPLITNNFYPSFYYVGIEDLSINRKKLKINRTAFSIDAFGEGGTILDSGTTAYFLDQLAYHPLEAGLSKLITYPLVDEADLGLRLCYDVGNITNPVFPTITIHFTGADFVVPQDNIFVAVTDDGNILCLAAIPSSGFSIIGNLVQQNFLMVYDGENSRVGFAPRQCDAGQ